MNREETRRAAEVMTAYADGKDVEWRRKGDEWEPVVSPFWNWDSLQYRIKPVQVEVVKWAWVINGEVHTCINEQVAKTHARTNGGKAVELKGTYTCDT